MTGSTMLRRLLIFLSLFLMPALAHARGIEPELIAEGPAPPGGAVELAIHMRTAPGWHGYWLNPGDAGLPMAVQWQLPKGASVGPLRYPVPSRLSIAGLMNYVFERDYAVLVRLNVPADAQGIFPVRASARWLACTDKICVPEQGQLSLDVPVGRGTPNHARFDAWRQQLAQPLATLGHFSLSGNRLKIAIPLPAGVQLRSPYLFPITDTVVDYEAPQSFSRSGDWLVAEVKAAKAPAEFDGVLASSSGRGLEFRALPGAVPEGGTALGNPGWSGLFWAVLGAIAGGILLNLMPCVFPILALKALHLSHAGGKPGEARLSALAYCAGTILGTGALGAALLAIRAAGAEAGWAFQLQDPRTIMLLLLLAVAITANLMGVFELPVLLGGARPTGSFGSGALAAFVATPCAGPFLGAALGTALLLPLAGSVAVFAALGLGLALPFLLVAFIPALRTRLPKPGPWMDRFKRFLSIPMAATALAALWLLYRLAGERALVVGLIVSAGLLIAAGLAGKIQRAGKSGAWGGALAAVGLGVLAILLVPQSAISHQNSSADSWSEARVEGALHQGKPVFVYFTADWCLTCKVNEATAIDRDEVQKAFRSAGVVVLTGDWTNGDPAITRFLESRGRAGVPLYLWYAPGKSPEELPQLLTPAILVSRVAALKR